MNFFQKFFAYFTYSSDGVATSLPEPYKDGLGLGNFVDIRHYLLILITICLVVSVYLLSQKSTQFREHFIKICCYMLLCVKLINLGYRTFIGADTSFYTIFPFDLHKLLCLIVPIIIIFNIEKLYKYVFPLAFTIGIYYIIFGNFFDNRFISFYVLEQMTSSIILICLSVLYFTSEGISNDIKSLPVVLGIEIFFVIIALLINGILLKDINTNVLLLGINNLPNKWLGNNFNILLIIVLLMISTLIYAKQISSKFFKKEQ